MKIIILFTYLISFKIVLFSKEIILFKLKEEFGHLNHIPLELRNQYNSFEVPEYDQYINDLKFFQLKKGGKLKKGDFLVFSSKKKFQLLNYLGSGGTSIVLHVKNEFNEERALRLSLSSHSCWPVYCRYYLKETILGYEQLQKVPGVVPVYVEESDPTEFISAKLLKVQFTLADFLENPTIGSNQKLEEEQLINFFSHFWMFNKIGDFGTRQIVYTPEGWFLVDWHSEHQLFSWSINLFYGSLESPLILFIKQTLPSHLSQPILQSFEKKRTIYKKQCFYRVQEKLVNFFKIKI